ncbi:hypothetical protein D3C79_901150 [compost metagenome]
MGVSLGEDHYVAGVEQQRRIIAQFDVAFALGDQVKDHHPLGSGLQERGCRVGAWRLVAPGCREPGVDENRADQADDAQGLRQGVHGRFSVRRFLIVNASRHKVNSPDDRAVSADDRTGRRWAPER